ncbi:MAG: ABC transporter permease subunit [Longicatena sp.]
MNGTIAFIKKEWMEHIRTYKFLIMAIIFIIFGIMSPLFAKLMPEVLKSMSGVNGISLIEIPTPTAIDSYTQFFKNVTQMGLIVLLLVFSGLLSQEISKGTLIPLLTKGLSRTSVILAKYFVALCIWTICYYGAFLITYLYTIFLFPSMVVHHLFISVLCAWLFGAFLLALFLFASSVGRGNYGGLLLSVLFIGLLFILNLIPNVAQYSPLTLISVNVEMLKPTYILSDIFCSFIITIVSSFVLLFSSVLVFKKKKL